MTFRCTGQASITWATSAWAGWMHFNVCPAGFKPVHELTHLTLTTTLWSRYYSLHLIKVIEVQRANNSRGYTASKGQSWKLNPGSLAPGGYNHYRRSEGRKIISRELISWCARLFCTSQGCAISRLLCDNWCPEKSACLGDKMKRDARLNNTMALTRAPNEDCGLEHGQQH